MKNLAGRTVCQNKPGLRNISPTFGGRNIDAYLGITWTPDGKIVFSSRVGHITDLYSINPDGRAGHASHCFHIASYGRDANLAHE